MRNQDHLNGPDSRILRTEKEKPEGTHFPAGGNPEEVQTWTEGESLETDSALQAELDRMARETPEMPEDFRRGWREAVRKEQGGQAAGPEKAVEPVRRRRTAEGAARQPEAVPSGGKTIRHGIRPLSSSWRRGLSTAAVVAFLLGGALLGQDAASLTRGAEKLSEADLQEMTEMDMAVSNAVSANGAADWRGAVEESAPSRTELPQAREAEAGAAEEELEVSESVTLGAVLFAKTAEAPTDEAAAENEMAVLSDGDGGTAEVEELAEEDRMEEMDPSEEETAEASPASRPFRTAGICLVVLAFVLAAAVLILRRDRADPET